MLPQLRLNNEGNSKTKYVKQYVKMIKDIEISGIKNIKDQ